jgi:hypothetical protein
MTGKQTLPVTLPSGVEPTREDLERLEAMLQALVGLYFEPRVDWSEAVGRLRSEGWDVGFRPGWIAEARRGHDFEHAFGDTRALAVAELRAMTDLDAVAGYSS